MHLRLLPVALALILASAGCLGAPDAPAPEGPAPVSTDAASLRALEETFTGTAMGTPAAPYAESFAFEVPSGAVGVNGTLAWSGPAGAAARFSLTLLDARGDPVAEGYPDASGALVATSIDPPRPGTWTFVVEAPVALNVPFELHAVAQLLVPEENVDREARTLGPASFYEINLILEANATFRFSFNSSQPTKWDIHSHPEEGIKYWQEGEGTTGEASFTAPERGVYSVLFENPGALDSELSYEVVGKFRLHSHGG